MRKIKCYFLSISAIFAFFIVFCTHKHWDFFINGNHFYSFNKNNKSIVHENKKKQFYSYFYFMCVFNCNNLLIQIISSKQNIVKAPCKIINQYIYNLKFVVRIRTKF